MNVFVQKMLTCTDVFINKNPDFINTVFAVFFELRPIFDEEKFLK